MNPPGSSQNRAWLWVGALYLFCFGLFVAALILKGPTELLAHFFFVTSEDTEYSSSYTEDEFQSIQLGQSAESVVAALGMPIREYAVEPRTSWLYADRPHPEFSQGGDYPEGSYTVLTFDEKGLFQKSWGQLASPSAGSGLASSTSISFGPGLNTLALSKEEEKSLRAEQATADDLRARYGEPREIYESRTVRWLKFSHSPGSTNYALRSVGVDREGRVCEIRSECYWD